LSRGPIWKPMLSSSALARSRPDTDASARKPGRDYWGYPNENYVVWLEDYCKDPNEWVPLQQFEDEFLHKYKARIIVGKGGMGQKTLAALKEVGAAYCSYTGGCGALAAKGLKEVRAYEWQDLGMPEALWVITAQDFGPLLVTMDSHGNSMHDVVSKKVEAKKADVYAKIGIKP